MYKYTGKENIEEFLLSLDLLNCKNPKKYIKTLYALSNDIENCYKVFKIKKRNGKKRTIHEPKPILKHIQRKLLDNLLIERKISNYATAYQRGISLKNNVEVHTKKNVILKLDISNFFESISIVNVLDHAFPTELFPLQIGMLFATLCTYDDHLVQGAPTSPYISNLIMFDFDEELGSWCKNNDIDYTRYSDDMTFSGSFDVRTVITKVKNLLKPLGLRLNYQKIHVIKHSQSQNVTGITVNEKIQIARKYRKKIRQSIYYIEKFGIESHLKYTKDRMTAEYYLESLRGKINYVLSIDNRNEEFKKYKNKVMKWRNEL